MTYTYGRRLTLGCLGLLAVGPLSGCVSFGPRVWVESQEHLELSGADVDTLSVLTYNGRVIVTGANGDGEAIVVTVNKRAGGLTLADAQECMDALLITTGRTGATQKLGWKYDGLQRSSWSAQVSFDITAPADLAVKARSHNGRLMVTGLHGDCILETYNGRIEAQTTSPKLVAETHNGRIKVSATPSAVHLTSYNGRIEADLDPPGDLQGTITTHNGSISVQLGEQTATNLTCRTHNGRVTYRGTLSELTASRSRVSGRIGESEAVLAIVTYNGSIDAR